MWLNHLDLSTQSSFLQLEGAFLSFVRINLKKEIRKFSQEPFHASDGFGASNPIFIDQLALDVGLRVNIISAAFTFTGPIFLVPNLGWVDRGAEVRL